MKIHDLSFNDHFYWKGKRYKQLIRPKNPPGKYTVVCCLYPICGEEWVRMPAGRVVKPIIVAKPSL